MWAVAAAAAIILCLLAWRLYKCLPALNPKKIPRSDSVPTMVVLGSGGHTGEIMPLVDGLVKTGHYTPLTFITANTDTLSKLHPLIPKSATIITIPRSRNVGQSFFTSIFTTVHSIFATIPLVFRKPRLLLVNGPGVCFPVVLLMFIGNFIGITNCTIVFVESLCRVNTYSLTAKLIYPMCDLFFVHWPQLLPLKKRAKLIDLFGLHKEGSK